MTYLEIVNEVLRRLREDTVTSVTNTDYSRLIGAFVKQSYMDCANAYDWPEFDETVDSNITASATSFTISSGDSGEGIYNIHSIYNVTDECFMKAVNYRWLRDKLSVDDDQNKPVYYAYGGEKTDSTTTIHIYPASDSSYTLRTSFNRKPDVNNSFENSTVIKLPEMPIILKAYALAVSERGEDGGIGYAEADMMARESLSDAIALYNGNTEGLRWYAC